MNTDKLSRRLARDTAKHRSARVRRAALDTMQTVAIIAVMAIIVGVIALTALAWSLP